MNIQSKWLGAILLLAWFSSARAAVFYVDVNSPNPTPPYAMWSTASTDIQSAVDAASDGDMIWVNDGVYQTGGRVVYGSLTNRVVINKAVHVQSVNGPSATTIQGNGPNSDSAVRCVYMTNFASLTGFTLTGGATRSAGDRVKENSGGGVWCEFTNSLLMNCVLVSNSAAAYGGGGFSGACSNCVFSRNVALDGGGASSNLLNDCTLVGNGSLFGLGAGAFGSVLNYCTVAWNTNIGIFDCVANGCIISNNFCDSSYSGAGAAISSLTNCAIVNNTSMGGGGGVAGPCVLTSCLVEGNVSVFGPGGGGALFSTLNNSIIAWNTCNGPGSAGGAGYECTFNNCLICRNSDRTGFTGAYESTLNNCTITGQTNGYAISDCNLTNCIVYDNFINYQPGPSQFVNCCTVPLPSYAHSDFENFTNDPNFLNAAAGDFHLQSNSPCINAGNNSSVTDLTDLDGNPRIVGGTVDIGAYEYQTPSSILSYAWAQQYGLPTDGSADFADSDHTGMSNWQKWIAGLNPTNPASVLAMLPPASTNNATGVTVSWDSVNTRKYYLLRATNLFTQPTFSAIQSNLVGQAGTTSFTDASATNSGPYFYQVGIQ